MSAVLAVFVALGVVAPPLVDATGPRWRDAHTVVFDYAHASWDHKPYEARDDGGGFGPATAPVVGHDRSVSPDGAHRASVLDGEVYVDGRPVHRGVAFAWLSASRLAVGLDGAATSIYAVPVDGGRASVLITGYSSSHGFDVSPDGSQIVFAAVNGWAYTSGTTLYVADTRGLDRNIRRISPDVCTVATGPRCFDGTNGADRIVGTRYLDIVVSGAGDDVIHAGDGQNIVQAQWGNDTILSGAGPDFVHAGSGDDVIRTGAGDDWINPGPGRDEVAAGRGADHIVANDGRRDVIDCGPGVDSVRADVADVTRNCEHVNHAPPQLDQGT